MANLELHSDSIKEVKNSAEKEKVLAESKKELNDLKNEMSPEEMDEKKLLKLIEDDKLDNWINNIKWNKNLEKKYKKFITRFIMFDYGPRFEKGAKKALGEKTFETIKSISKKSGPYEKLSDSKKMEIWKLLLLEEITTGYYEFSDKGSNKIYNYCKPRLEAQINKMK